MRLRYLIRKEFIQLRRDKRLMFLLFFFPLLQLIIFGYIFSTDVKHISMGVYDQAKTSESRAIVSSFKSAGYFTIVAYPESRAVLNDQMLHGNVQCGIVILRDFSDISRRGGTPSLQVLVDGSDPNTGGTALQYATAIIQTKAASNIKVNPVFIKNALPLDYSAEMLYNPELKSSNYMVPGLIGTLIMMVMLLIASASLVKEREHGTMEQLIVMPFKKWEIILGKLLPFVIVGLLDATFIAVAGTLWFGVPFRGSPLLLLLFAGIFVFANLGLGLFVSTVSRTQQQAMMTAYFIVLPSMILSGLIFPIESMPTVVQWMTYLLPIRYFLIIVRGIFLKGAGLAELWQQGLILTIYCFVLFGLSVARFQKRLT